MLNPNKITAMKTVTPEKPQGNLTGHVHKLTREERSRGGKKGAEGIRRYYTQKQVLEQILSLSVRSKKIRENMLELGIEEGCLDNEHAIAIRQLIKALDGDTNAYKAIIDRVDGQAKSEAEVKLNGELNTRPYEGMTKEELRELLKK